MATMRRNVWALVSAMGLLAGTGCGGAGGADGGPAAGRSATVKGSVQSFSGGVVVNGVAFRTSGASLRDDSGPSATLSGEAEIRGRVAEGEVVTIRGRLDDGGASGEATEIEVHHGVEGEVEWKGPGAMGVAGVTVSTDDATAIADRHGNPLAPDDVAVGERVEISGHADGRGGLHATSVRESADPAGSERELRAFVVAVSGTVVDLSTTPGGPVSVRVDVGGISPPPSVAVGMEVEVRTAGAADANGVFAATSLHPDDDLAPAAGDETEVEGIVTAVDASGFTVGDQAVSTGPSTEFRGGTADDVVPGVKLEVEGTLGQDGVLAAREVKFRPSARVEANAGAIDAAASTFEVLGLVVHVTPSTDLRGLASLSALPAGAFVQVRGNPTADGAGLNATRVELLDPRASDRAFLRGVVTEKTPTSSLAILGLAVDTSAAELRSASGGPMDAAAFFDAIAPGQTIVKVRWRPYPSSTAEPVEEAELEN